MKKLILIPALLCLFMLNVASMCSSDDDDPSPTNPTTLNNIVSQGTWRVTNFIDSGTDETNHFAGYNFTFGPSNVLTATNGVNTSAGTWSITSEEGDDDNSEDLDFNIGFAQANFNDLTADWDIVSYSSTNVTLVHVSGGNGGTDALVLAKN